jgi:hypothetical protein
MTCSRGLSAFLALVLSTACASGHRLSVPEWPRYQDGELAGFLQAPDEQVVREVPRVVVQRARGRAVASTAQEQRDLQLNNLRPTTQVADSEAYRTPDLGVVDTRMFVAELRGPGSSDKVRTVATRNGVFDFGPLPDGTYTLKVTASGAGFALGWRSRVKTVIVSDAAGTAGEIDVVFPQ